MPNLYLFLSQHQQGSNKLHAVFLTDAPARAFVVPGVFADTYEQLLASGGVVAMDLPEKEYRKVVKTGVVYVAFGGTTRAGYPVPAHASPSKSGLVKKAAAGDYLRTAFQLFEDSHQAGAFLVDGYAMPVGFARAHKFSGPHIDTVLA